MNKPTLPTTRAFHLIWQIAPFLDWLCRSVKWRVRACWFIANWIIMGDESGKNHPFWKELFRNRGTRARQNWEFYREMEFQRIKIDPGCQSIQVEVMQPVMGFKHNSEGQLEQTFKMKPIDDFQNEGNWIRGGPYGETTQWKPGGAKPDEPQ